MRFRSGETVEYRRDPIVRSDYHAQLDKEVSGRSPAEGEDVHVKEDKVRYWSDYSRLFFHPRSLHRLPDPPDWEDTDGDWVAGTEMFQKYDEVCVLFQGSILY